MVLLHTRHQQCERTVSIQKRYSFKEVQSIGHSWLNPSEVDVTLPLIRTRNAQLLNIPDSQVVRQSARSVRHTVTPSARMKDRVARPARTRPQDIVLGARTKAVVQVTTYIVCSIPYSVGSLLEDTGDVWDGSEPSPLVISNSAVAGVPVCICGVVNQYPLTSVSS